LRRKGCTVDAHQELHPQNHRLTTAADRTGDATQPWLLNANGQIVGEASGKCLDVSGQASADGSKVILYSCNGGPDEAWSRQ
jgi:hypothetical protein